MKSTITIFICIVIMLVSVIPAACDDQDAESPAAVYSQIIDDFSAHCLFKTNLRYARGRHIRNAAAISCLKNNYWQNHKAELVKAMIDAGIGTRRYQVRYFLNSRFLAYAQSINLDLKAVHPLAALPEQPPEGFEKMTLADFCRHFCVPEKEAAQRLHAPGGAPDENQRIAAIASGRGVSPLEVYRTLRLAISRMADSDRPAS